MHCFGLFSIFVSLTGVCHGDDCSYYSPMVTGGNLDKDTDEWRTIERMCEIFTAFARVGNPNNDLMGSIEWKPITVGATNQNDCNHKCLNVSNEVSYIDWPDFDRMQFWDEIFQCYHRKLVN